MKEITAEMARQKPVWSAHSIWDLVNHMTAERGIPPRQIELASAQEVQATDPCAYGVFCIVLDGKLLSYIYLVRDDFEKRVAA